jgi:hypothetical protein
VGLVVEGEGRQQSPAWAMAMLPSTTARPALTARTPLAMTFDG